ncbi:MAG: 3-hydroxyacyl-CoA dehydrogenase family protein [Desulfatiglandales bacterium]
MQIKKIGVVGAGQMGSGISEVCLSAGYLVLMSDISEEALQKGRDRIVRDYEKAIKKGKMLLEQRDLFLGYLTTATDMAGFKDCDYIIEAATENIALKEKVFQTLDRIAGSGVILASNTSSVSISRIASFTKRPERVIGLHFFNPVPLMNLVEIIPTLTTSRETIETTRELSLKLGKTPLEANDFPGFISSRLLFNLMNEAIYLLYEGVGKAESIDEMMKLGANHPMGPLALADFVGLDTVLSVMKILREAFGDKYQPCPLLVRYVESGYLGVKSGRGFYDYGGKK